MKAVISVAVHEFATAAEVRNSVVVGAAGTVVAAWVVGEGLGGGEEAELPDELHPAKMVRHDATRTAAKGVRKRYMEPLVRVLEATGASDI